MDPGTAFAVVAICYQAGQQLIEICNSWRSAHEELQARVVIVESAWDRSKRQVEFMQRISPIIDDNLLRNLDDLLNQLYMQLVKASRMIESVQERESGRWARLRASRAVYVWKKDALDLVIRELEDWQRRFDPSWFLIMTIANPAIDRELQKGRASAGAIEAPSRGPPNAARNPLAVASSMRNVLDPAGIQTKSVFLPECPLDVLDIRYSDAKQCRLLTGRDDKWYIVDSISCTNGRDINALTQDVRQLAARLSQADPFAFGLLNCKGVMRATQRNQPGLHPREHISALNIIFRVPDGMTTLQSLRENLLRTDSQVSLTQRVRIAVALAKSISYVHTFNFVHKNVRPESVLCFDDSQNQRNHTFLVGFDAFRAADGNTLMAGDWALERNLYRHPERYGEYPVSKYNMQHDIYSLGVCLLEIGLWESFVQYQISGNFWQIVPSDWYRNFQAWLISSNTTGRAPSHLEMPWKVKDYLVELAKSSLPVRMGEKYTKVVMACLTCVENSASLEHNAGAVAAEDQGMAIAVGFVEQALSLLSEISM